MSGLPTCRLSPAERLVADFTSSMVDTLGTMSWDLVKRLRGVRRGWAVTPSSSVTVVMLPGGQRVRVTLTAEPMPDPPAGGS